MTTPQFSAREIDLLVALADGSLSADQREAAERELLSRPEACAALERQRRTVAVVRGAAPKAPEELRRRIESPLERPTRRAIGAPRRVWSGWRRPALGVALAAATVAVLAVLLVPSSGESPTVAEVAQLAERGSTAAAPRANPIRQGMLAEEAEGIPYPDWTKAFGWLAEGARVDRIAGRRAETVFYEHEGHQIGYTILAGGALDPPEDARRSVRHGQELYAYRDGPRDVVVFERNGKTCVLSGEVLRQETLLKLAAWRPGQPGSESHPHA